MKPSPMNTLPSSLPIAGREPRGSRRDDPDVSNTNNDGDIYINESGHCWYASVYDLQQSYELYISAYNNIYNQNYHYIVTGRSVRSLF